MLAGQSHPVFVTKDVSESDIFLQNAKDGFIYNQSETNTWDSDNSIENKNSNQVRSRTTEDNNNDILALASFYDRPEYR